MKTRWIGHARIAAWIFFTFMASAAPLGAAAGAETDGALETAVSGATANSPSPVPAPVLPPVTIIAAPELSASGQATISEEEIKRLPSGNGSINELLDTLPGVQLGEGANSSRQGGEIVPPNVSITGGKVFDNNFLLDGIGNNSLLDPVFTSVNSVLDAPGHPQEIFLDSRLVKEVTVYRSNVPARFGEFTGGVVDARTRDPQPEFAGAVFYRTTRDAWTSFHVAREDQDSFDHSHDASRQPEFSKHHGGAELDIPLGPDAGLLASYVQLYSRIPLEHLGAEKTQSRRRENFFLKGKFDLSADDSLRVTVTHAPYREEHFKANTKNSDALVRGGGTAVSATYSRFLATGGALLVEAGLKKSENTRQAPAHHYSWLNLGEKDWGEAAGTARSFEGGFGDIEKTQTSGEVRTEFTFPVLTAGPSGHELTSGLEFAWAHAEFERRDSTMIFALAAADENVLCDLDPLACADKEQFFYRRTVYEADSADATMNRGALYLQDQIDFGRLDLRPGLRFSYDDFMQNANLAPRLAAAFDLSGDERTRLVAGWNRYYGRSLLTYKLREARRPARTDVRSQELGADNRPGAWTSTYATSVYRFTELETPYADEATVGLEQVLPWGRLQLGYVRRDGKDEFAQEKIAVDGATATVLNNNGRSRHEEVSATWEHRWGGHFLSVNATWQETETNAEDYEALLDEERLAELVWYEGDVMHRSGLPRQDFNRRWVANLVYAVELPRDFTFTNVTRYRSGYQGLELIPAAEWPAAGVPEGVNWAYREARKPESWIFDWKIGWRRQFLHDQDLLLSLEIYNVFDEKVNVGGADDEFELGRQFWAAAEYRF